jgi:AcrR family transcriptional regulator
MAEFAERGLDAPSLDGICARAGFTRGAFYVHVRDREDLIAAVTERILGAFVDAVVATETGDRDLETTVNRFAAVVAALDDRGAAEAAPGETGAAPFTVPFHQLLAACQRAPGLRRRFASILEDATRRLADAARREVDADADPDAVARLLVLVALGVRVARELGLELHTAAVRDAALRMLGALR